MGKLRNYSIARLNKTGCAASLATLLARPATVAAAVIAHDLRSHIQAPPFLVASFGAWDALVLR
jgi:hypothetical protein